MSIRIEVPLEALARPGITHALSALVAELGQLAGVVIARSTEVEVVDVPAPNPFADTRPSTGSAAAPAGARFTARGNGRRNGATGRETDTGPKRRASNKPRPRRKGATREDLSGLPPAERWLRYLSGRPPATHQFLRLLETRGQLTVDEAVSELRLDNPKAMGGLTGAMVRWAPKQGVALPFEAAEFANGERGWKWTGLPEA